MNATCRELVEFLADYLAGELDERTRAEFERHLARCPSCVAYMSTYGETVELARAASQAPDAPVPEELVRAILAARGA